MQLTKVINHDGRECVACVYYGTDKCHIHSENDVNDCAHCKVFGAMLNKLNLYETAYENEEEDKNV